MRTISKEELSEILKKHKMWLDGDPDGERADLSGAKLSGAKLSGADLSGANIDYSVLPLWCVSLNAGFDDKQIKQIAYHMVKSGLNSKNTSEETKHNLIKMIDFANEFHRVKECGIITYEGEIAHDNQNT